MNFEIRFKSIAVRWFTNVFTIVAATVLIAIIAFSFFFANVYVERIETLAEDYTLEFETLASTNSESFEDAAVNLSDSFQYKSKIEVQVIDTKGKVLVSTTGFEPIAERMPDYEKAIAEGSSGTATYRGKNSAGESVFAKTTLIKNGKGEVLGAYRWITSMNATNKYVTYIVLILLAIGMGVISFCAFSGLYFIKSIVNPIRDVSNTARKIAMGDFETKIEIERDDEIGELCDTINYMATELQQAETIKNDFISSVSHELRTPLTAIRGWGETAKMSIGADEELVAKGIDVVLSEADRLSGLVEELLDFSRMQSGRLTVNTQPLDASYLLESAADMYHELARQQGIELSYNKPTRSSIVMGDGDRLKQVFINIIDNAVKYTEKGGLVLVTETREEGCIRIVVKDTGVGIPASDIDRVKEKFFKSNKTVRGSGIGLAVADEIIKQHQGLLFLESTEGVGTTVTIVLPLYEEPEEIAPADSEGEEVIPAELAGSTEEIKETETKEE